MSRPLSAASMGMMALILGQSPAISEEIEELIVTASREARPLSETGSAFSLLEARDIDARQSPVLADLLRDLPGLAVSPTGPLGAQTQIRIRGAEGNQTLALIDGIEATDPVGNFELDFADLLSVGVTRIEVIRGPQSALYGSEAIGGVINILTRGPDAGAPRLEAFAEGGSFATVRLGASAVLGEEAQGIVLSAGYLDSRGISASPTGSERDGYENVTLSAKGRLALDSGLVLGMVARYVGAKSEIDDQDFLTGAVIDGDGRRRFDAFYGRLYAELPLHDARWRHRLSLDLTDTDSDNFDGADFLNSFSGQRVKIVYQNSLDILGSVLTTAVEHEALDFRARAALADDPLNQRADDDQTALVAEWHGRLHDRLSLTAGVRHDFNGTFRDETTWRLAAVGHLDAVTRLHGSVGTGVSDPTFFDRFGFFPDQFLGNPDLSPEMARGWDIGIERQILPDRLSIDLTWFSSRLRDEIVPTFDPVTFLSSVVNQTGTSRRDGVELSLHLELTDWARFDAAYSYLDAEEPDGAREVRRARHIASATLVASLLDGRGEISLDLDYNGRQFDLDFSQFPAARVRLESYSLVTLAAKYRIFDGVELFGRIENLLDQSYRAVLGFNTPGIGAHAGLRARF